MFRIRARRVLIPLLGLPVALLAAVPAQAHWTTLDGVDPVQFDHVCHDGLSWDWAHLQVTEFAYQDGVARGFDWKAYALKWQQAQSAYLTFPLYRAGDGGPDQKHGSIATARTAVPYHPTVVSTFDDPNPESGFPSIHLLEGHLGVRFNAQDWRPTKSGVWAGGLDTAVTDCYLYAGVKATSRTTKTITVALLGSKHLKVAKLDATTFRLHPTKHYRVTLTAPSKSSLADVNHDGHPDLVLRFRRSGTGLADSSSAAVLTGKTVGNGLLTATVKLPKVRH